MYKVNKVQSQTGEIILLEDQSQPLPSPSVFVASMDSYKILDAHIELLRGSLTGSRRRGLSVAMYSTEQSSINPALRVALQFV